MSTDIEIPLSVKLICGGLVVSMLYWVAYSMVSEHLREAECFPHAKRWVETTLSPSEALRDPRQTEFFAKQLATYNLACPKGHIMVRQDELGKIPEAVAAMSRQPQIIEAARAGLDEKY